MADTVVLTFDEVRWQVLPHVRDALFGPAGLALAEWLRDGRARVVKQGPHRTVYRVQLPGVDFHLKHYPVYDVRAWLRQLLRPSKGRTEFEIAEKLAERGVPTFVPLALGEKVTALGTGDSWLITETLAATDTLSAFIETTLPTLDAARQTLLRQQLAVALGRFTAQMHNAGVLHHDFHAGNVLIRWSTAGVPELFLIDLHAVRLPRHVGWRRGRDNLVMLNRWFQLRVSRTDRLRCWHAYRQERDAVEMAHWQRALESNAAELARDVECRTWRSNLLFWRNRDRRCLVSNRYYRRVASEAAIGHAVTELDPSVLKALLADPDEPFRREGVTLLKDSRSSTVADLEIPVGGQLRRVIYKRFRVTAWKDPFLTLLRRSAAVRSWLFGHGLRERWLPTARPLLVLHRRRNGLQQEGYLLTEKIDNAVELQGFLTELAAWPPRERLRLLRRHIDALGRLVRDLHSRQLSQRDLKAANILVRRPETADATPALWFIDLVGLDLFEQLPRGRRVQNLARLHASFHQHPGVTRTDKLRFLRVYLQWGLRGRGDWKDWWRSVERVTRAKIARNVRNGRPLA